MGSISIPLNALRAVFFEKKKITFNFLMLLKLF